MSNAPQENLFALAGRCLEEPDPARKLALTHQAAAAWRDGALGMELSAAPRVTNAAGLPAQLELVPPRRLVARKLSSRDGRAAMIHAVAHIELNAVNLAWDAVQRFRDMPTAFYADWIQVADEEAAHFALMAERLSDLGHDYGDFPAHNGLWAMAEQTAHDALTRMAMVPRVLEARGLDVTPGMIARFELVDDAETAKRLGVILREEVGHVAAGSRWLKTLCEARGEDPTERYFALLDEYMPGDIRCPLNLADRRRAGFDESELEALQARCQR